MKKTFLIITALLCWTLYSAGQTPSGKYEIKWGPKTKISRKILINDIITSDESEIYVLKYKRKGMYGFNKDFYLDHYNQNLELINSLLLQPVFEDKKMEFEQIISMNDKLYLFSSFLNKKL